jgi:iron complex outermembrane recepter protein
LQQHDQDFLPVSGGVGVLYDFSEGWQLAINGTYSQPAPTAEELFARGPHDATFQFIIGDSIHMIDNNPSHRTTLRRFSV